MSNFNQDHFFTKTEKGYFLACGEKNCSKYGKLPKLA